MARKMNGYDRDSSQSSPASPLWMALWSLSLSCRHLPLLQILMHHFLLLAHFLHTQDKWECNMVNGSNNPINSLEVVICIVARAHTCHIQVRA